MIDMKKARSVLLPLALLPVLLGSSALPRPTASAPAETTFNEVAKDATPAVVSISVIKKEEQQAGRVLPGLPLSPDDASDQKSLGIGTGVLIRKDGYILTNHHVIENAEKITVKFDDKHKFAARMVGVDPDTDLAIIKIKEGSEGYPTLPFGDSARVKVGDWAIAIGSPFGLNRSISKGIVSAMGRAQIGILDVEDFIQTDAAINPGSSGGPLLNMNGEIIGINTAIFSQGAGFVGIGFAIPAEIAREVAGQLIAHGRVRRGWIGATVQDLDEDLARYFHAPGTQGALVSNVMPRGPADQASLRPGDIILRYNGKPVTNASDFKKSYSQSHSGSVASTEILRDGSKRRINLSIAERPQSTLKTASHATQQAGKVSSKPRSLGLTIEEIPDEIAELLKMKNSEGVLIVGVEPGSPAFEAGLSPGDIVLRANGKDLHSTQDFTKMSSSLTGRDLSMLYVQRGPEEKLFVPLKMDS